MVSQCTKFEVSRFTRYKAMNGSAECRKWGGLGQLGGTQRHGKCHGSIERICNSTLIGTMRLSSTVFEIEPAICRKSPILTHLTYIWRPRRGWSPSNFAEIFGIRKLVSLGYRGCCLCDPTFSRLVEHGLVTDRYTDTGPWLVPRMHSIAR